MYADENGVRTFETVALNEVIERLKQGLSPVPETNGNNAKLLFCLSPNDLIYVPSEEELVKGEIYVNGDRIYKMVSSSGPQCFFIKGTVATCIVNKLEFSPLNKMERAISGEMIKEICIPIKVDRLGNIIYIGTEYLP